MATLVLQMAGAFVGEMIGGPIGAVVGRAVGAVAGSYIDQRLMGGSQHREGPRLKAMHGLSSTEGAPVPRVYGRARIGGEVIWATRFLEVAKESSAGGGKGGGPTVTEYSYFANVAVGLCEGPAAFVRRVWADGKEVDLGKVTMRVYLGDESQAPDPLIVAKEGAENAPAYRGLAYVVFERLPLADYGNRIPQLSFEVVRPVGGVGSLIRGVDLIPAATEYAYSVMARHKTPGAGVTRPETRHVLHAESDWVASIDALQALCPNLESVALVVAWFGDDLRAGQCTIAPRVETRAKIVPGAPWSVAGLSRATAREVSTVDGLPAYGGAPSDDTVAAAIRDLKARGLHVTFYPFVMMDVPADNALADPWTGQGAQPAYPWRGRITCDPAPGREGSPDATPQAAAQIAGFFGSDEPPTAEWSYRRFILHYAQLCRDAGGVDAFLVGSEMAALTRARSGPDVYPAVDALVRLTRDARALLGPETKLSYAADWTEYGSHVPAPGELRFPLDPLWASPDIDFVGLDAYWPLSDWRDGEAHLDARIAPSIHDRDYLRARVAGGEGFDWYYPDDAARRAQDRRAITDGAYGKPWVYRPKDLRGWWSNVHTPRFGGVEAAQPTAWVACSKPIWLIEIGCGAVDRGANAPNVFPDPKSSESALPHFSRGGRDDLIQARAVEATLRHFADEAKNPASPLYGGRMVDVARIHVWCWDARPFPAFPTQGGVWADACNYETGHWLNGRLEAAHLDALVAELAAGTSLAQGFNDLRGVVDGYVVDRPMSPRAAIEGLGALFGFDAVVSSGALGFASRATPRVVALGADDLAPDKQERLFQLTRGQDADLPRELTLAFADAERDYRQTSVSARRIEGASRRLSQAAIGVVMRRSEMRRLADIWLRDLWAARETASFTLRPGRREIEVGDCVALPVADGARVFRITRIDDGFERAVEARALQPSIHDAAASAAEPVEAPSPPSFGPPLVHALDLALARGSPPPLQHLAIFADPWPGRVAVWRRIGEGGFDLVGVAARRATIGVTRGILQPGPVARWDHAASVEVGIAGGALASVSDVEALAGKTTLAIQGEDGAWEILAFARAELVAANVWRLSRLLRGLGGESHLAGRSVAAGAPVVLLDSALFPLTGNSAEPGAPALYRIGPADRDHADASYIEIATTATARALRLWGPAHLRARRSAAGIEIAFIRRARIDGDTWETLDPPLGEERETYRIAIRSGAATLRQWQVAQPSALYAIADELADFGAPQTALDIAVAQVSATIGEGFETIARIAVA